MQFFIETVRFMLIAQPFTLDYPKYEETLAENLYNMSEYCHSLLFEVLDTQTLCAFVEVCEKCLQSQARRLCANPNAFEPGFTIKLIVAVCNFLKFVFEES